MSFGKIIDDAVQPPTALHVPASTPQASRCEPRGASRDIDEGR
jgi:hypothetical protein